MTIDLIKENNKNAFHLKIHYHKNYNIKLNEKIEDKNV